MPKVKIVPKVLFQLYIDVVQFNWIMRKSEETGLSRAAIVRDILDASRKLETAKKKEKKSLLKEFGQAESP